ncbi:MAG TPA: NAD(P)H-dependent oxidoreductase [Chitinophagaceae bacterium]
MAKLLVLFAHPALEKSRVHTRMIKHIHHLPNVYFHDLYETYPDLDIDVEKEKKLLLDHELIIWQHPFYWYSAPAIIKQWMDLVLEHNWAYGSHGKMLAGKKIFNSISTGGKKEAYCTTGRNHYSIPELLAPFEQTARLCRMDYLPPFVVHGTHRLADADIELHAVQYEQLLVALTNDRISEEEYRKAKYLNDIYPIPEQVQS